MAQHDYVIANGTGAAVRSDLNNALAAIVSQNSGATEPATTYAYQWWADTTTNLLKLRNSANSGWITLFQLDGEYSTIALENGTAAAPSIYFKDSGTDTGFYSPGANQVGISTGGTARLTIDSNGNVNIDSNTLYVDAANNRVGLGTSSPSQLLTAVGNIKIAGAQASNTAKLCLTRTDTSWSINNETDLRFYYGTGDTDSPATAGVAFTSIGRVGIGTTSPSAPLHVNGTANSTAITFSVAGTVTGYIGPAGFIGGSDVNMGYRVESGNNHVFHIGATERARIDSSGRLLVGTSTASSAGAWAQYAFIKTQGNTSAATGPGVINIARGEAATAITTDENIGAIAFTDQAGNEFAVISSAADADAGSGDYPGRLVFSTTADGASSPTARMRINSSGNVDIGLDGIRFTQIRPNGYIYSRGGDIDSFIRCEDTSANAKFTVSAAGNGVFAGSLSKGSGSFRIDHPLESKKDTHHLVHSFVEAPQADLIYRGHVQLSSGFATVNIDSAARMSEGTFEALCTNVCCFTTNESDWTPVRGSVSGNTLTIEAQDPASTAQVCWMVIGERKDQHMLDTDWTDENGRVITEPLKEAARETL